MIVYQLSLCENIKTRIVEALDHHICDPHPAHYLSDPFERVAVPVIL